MTTKKQDLSAASETPSKRITKHKATRRAVQAPPQAFDIIPRSQVRPSSNARPVIPSTQPEVADNTLTSAPKVQLSHQVRVGTTSFEPLILESDETAVSEPTAADSPGVSVADLIAKQHESLTVSPPTATVTKAAEKPLDNASPTGKTETKMLPVEPQEPAVASSTEPELAKNIQPNVTPAGNTLADVLKDDASGDAAPAEHSDVLKGALKDLDEDEKDSNGRHHPEMYGGKPVIVVHKAHESQSAVMWLLWFIICLGLAILIVNFLLDAGVIATTYNVPHTNIL